MSREESLVTDNLGLVHLAAKRFMQRGIDYEDIYQAGCLGLIKAAKKFDASLGYKFSTYAVPVIIGEIKSLFRYGTEIKIPRDIKSIALKITEVRMEFEKKFGRAPYLSEIVKLTGIDEDKLTAALSSLNPVIYSDDEKEIFAALSEESHENNITEKLALKECCEKLKSDEKELVYLRFKLNKTQSETAKIFGVSQMQISRKERKILLYLRGVLED